VIASTLLVPALVAGLAQAPAPEPAATAERPPVASAPVSRPDTVLEVRRGDRLLVENLTGRISVRVGRGDRIEVDLDRSDEGSITLVRRGDRIVMDDRDSKGRQLDRRLAVTVPEWLDVDLRGRRLDIDVAGLRSSVAASTLAGDIAVRDIEGAVRVATVSGGVSVEDVRGTVDASAIEESIVLAGIRGVVRVEAVDGDVSLEDIDSSEVEVATVSGDVEFDGVIRPGGRYSLVTHDGDVTVAVQQDVSARVSVSTFDGSFEARFPVTLQQFRGGREMTFTLGDGSAQLRLQAFDGEIVLLHRR